MTTRKFKHDIDYFSVNESIYGFIPTMDYFFRFKSKELNELPGCISNNEEPLFSNKRNKKTRVKRVLVLTDACNLNCSYCFEGDVTRSRSMSLKQVEDIIIEMFKEARDKNKNLISFSLFGGEPTIEWESVEKAINTANKLSKKYDIECIKAIVTNGLMSPDKTKYLSKNFDYVYVSLDGPKEIFLNQRKPKNQNDVYELIFENCQILYNSGVNLSFKVTVSKDSLDKMCLIEDFFAFHFPAIPRLYQPCMVEKSDPQYITFSSFIESFYQMQNYTCFPKNLNMPLYKKKPSDRFCNLAIRNVIYPDMSVLACHRSNMCIPDDIVRQNFYVGRCEHGKLLKENETIDKLKDINVDNINPCKKCFARLHCCGGCPTVKLFFNKDYLDDEIDYCNTIKKYFILNAVNYLEGTNHNFNTKVTAISNNNDITLTEKSFTKDIVSAMYLTGDDEN